MKLISICLFHILQIPTSPFNFTLNATGQHNLLPFIPGQGSTTVFKLALGLYPTTSGHILFDGHHIDNLNVTNLRRSISLSPQTPYVPLGPLGEIFSGPLTASDDELIEFLDAFQPGYGRIVEDGSRYPDSPVRLVSPAQRHIS